MTIAGAAPGPGELGGMSLTPTNAWYESPRSMRYRVWRAIRVCLVVALILAAIFVVEGVVLTLSCAGPNHAECVEDRSR